MSHSTQADSHAREAALAAKQSAWDRFYEYCFEVIRSSPSVRRLSDSDRDDCVQDVMLEIVKKFGAAQTQPVSGGVEGWIRVVSKHKAADIVRRRIRKPEVGFDDGSGEAVPSRAQEQLAHAENQGESVSLVWEALLRLDSEVTVTSYLIFFLRTIEGWSVPEIAEVMQISAKQARFRCHRVKRRFEEILKDSSAAKLGDH